MFGARHAIIITFKSIPSDVDAVFEDFKSILNEFDPNKHLDLYWEKNSIVTESVSMIKERGSMEVKKVEPIPEASGNTLFFRTRIVLKSMDFLSDNLAAVTHWVEKGIHPVSVEVTSSLFKYPLFFKNKLYRPNNTWYDLKKITKEEQTKIDELNKQIKERKKSAFNNNA